MRIASSSRNERGLVLLVCLIVFAVIGFSAASYLTLVGNENASVNRSAAWNNALVVAEAGVEDSLAFMNQGNSWSNTAVANNWQALPNNVFYTQRSIGSNSYSVYITNTAVGPVISSTGSVPWSGSWFSGAPPARRTVLVTTDPKSFSLYAILVKSTVNLSGGSLLDSFNGPVYDPANRTADLVIGTDATNLVQSVRMSGGQLYGHVETGAGSTISVSGSATIGDTNWVANNTGVQPGAVADTLNVQIPDAPTAPADATYLPLPPAVNNTYYLIGSPFTNYYTVPDSFAVKAGQSIVITGGGTVALNCVGSFTVSGSGYILLTNNTRMLAYLNGKTTLSGSGVINADNAATMCQYYGSPNCTTMTYSGGANFIGMINTPYADVTDSGSAAFIGSIIANSFTDSGGAAFHYPGYLGNPNDGYYYTVATWQEVSP